MVEHICETLRAYVKHPWFGNLLSRHPQDCGSESLWWLTHPPFPLPKIENCWSSQDLNILILLLKLCYTNQAQLAILRDRSRQHHGDKVQLISQQIYIHDLWTYWRATGTANSCLLATTLWKAPRNNYSFQSDGDLGVMIIKLHTVRKLANLLQITGIIAKNIYR